MWWSVCGGRQYTYKTVAFIKSVFNKVMTIKASMPFIIRDVLEGRI